jgi:hypothetical protein
MRFGKQGNGGKQQWAHENLLRRGDAPTPILAQA